MKWEGRESCPVEVRGKERWIGVKWGLGLIFCKNILHESLLAK